MNTQPETAELEVIPSGSLEAITRAEVDVQIATAHKFPRSMATFKRRALEMATLDEETAASCLYSRPVGGGKFAEGMSIRMAEIVGASYGNLRVGAMIISQTERQVVCRGFAHDLESNFASTSEVVEATIKKDGRPYDERMRVVIAKACLAKARRDATFQVVPKALCKPVEAEARRVAIGDAQTIAKKRSNVITWIERLGIDKARVWKALNIAGEDDIGIDELTTLTGLKTAIKDGEVSVDEAFPDAAKARVGAPPATEKKEPAKEQPKEPAKTPETPAETVNPEPEPEAETGQEPAPEPSDNDGGPETVEIPEDPGALLALAKDTIKRADLSEKGVVRALKKLKKCGLICVQISDVARSGLVYVVENIGVIVKWLDENQE